MRRAFKRRAFPAGGMLGDAQVPIFRPTLEEMAAGFEAYVEQIEAEAWEYGICVIEPPPEWQPRSRGYEDVEVWTIPKPIKQHVSGSRGVFQSIHVETKSVTVREFRAAAHSKEHRGSWGDDGDICCLGNATDAANAASASDSAEAVGSDCNEGEEASNEDGDSTCVARCEGTGDASCGDVEQQQQQHFSSSRGDGRGDGDGDARQKECKHSKQSKQRKHSRRSKQCRHVGGKLTLADMQTSIERSFWKNVTHSPPLYGADGLGSFFDADVQWINSPPLYGADGLGSFFDADVQVGGAGGGGKGGDGGDGKGGGRGADGV
ncbi:unnamed protein product [Closterium sp. NIES-54]